MDTSFFVDLYLEIRTSIFMACVPKEPRRISTELRAAPTLHEQCLVLVVLSIFFYAKT